MLHAVLLTCCIGMVLGLHRLSLLRQAEQHRAQALDSRCLEEMVRFAVAHHRHDLARQIIRQNR